MNKRSQTFNPVTCYEQLRSNMLAHPHYTSQGQRLMRHQGMSSWLEYIETLNLQLATETTPIADIAATSSPHLPAAAGMRSRLNPLLADIVLTIYRGGL